MRVVIHADASPSIGTGHVIRCLALGSALRAEGAEITLASDEMVDALRARISAHRVSLVAREGASVGADWVVFDSYQLDSSARSSLTPPGARTLVIDDLGNHIDGATVTLNQNLYATPAGPTRPVGETELLPGPTYALLRPEFLKMVPERAQPAFADRVLVTMGGADPGDATTIVVEALAALQPRPQARIIVGGAHPAPAAVERLAASVGFDVVRDVPSLAAHLAWADLVISGCGTSVLEVARAGRPMIGLVLADNQRRVADAVENEGIGVVPGRHPGLSRRALLKAIEAMRADRDWRNEASGIGPTLVDGHGASRVARVFRTGPLRLRVVTMADGDLLLRWRNERSARDASFDTRPIDPAAHFAWLAHQLESPSARIWIGTLDDGPVGAVRFALNGATATISVALTADRRSAGIGTRLISMGCTRLAAESGVRTVDAWIRRENGASVTAFRRARFRPSRRDREDRLLYRLMLEPM